MQWLKQWWTFDPDTDAGSTFYTPDYLASALVGLFVSIIVYLILSPLVKTRVAA